MNNRFKKGFTLVELAVIILLVGIVAAFIIPSLVGNDDSSQVKATEFVKGYLMEYKSEHANDYEEDVVIVNITDSTMFIFGYNFSDDLLYVFSKAPWLAKACEDAKQTGDIQRVAKHIAKSAVWDSLSGGDDLYPDARGLFTYDPGLQVDDIILNSEFSERTQKKLADSTVFMSAKLADATGDTAYSCEAGGIVYYIAYAEPELLDNSVADAAEYMTTFDLDGGNISLDESDIVFNASETRTFECPKDPVKDGKYFLYWKLISVNGESCDIPATALVPGERYEVPNSDVIYKAVYTSEEAPEKVDGVYRVYNAHQLNWLGENDKMDANIELARSFRAGAAVKPIGTSSAPYTGTFDGKGYKIIDLEINGEEHDTHQALFAYTENATVKNLTLESPQIRGFRFVSALVARAKGGAVTNCNITDADVKAADSTTVYMTVVDAGGAVSKETGTYCGGLVAYGTDVTVRGCEVTGNVDGGNSGSAIGGIMGVGVGSVNIENSSNKATVQGVRYVGGILGKSVKGAETAIVLIDNCYNAGRVTRTETLLTFPAEGEQYHTTATDYCIGYGGIIGGATGDTRIQNCTNAKSAKVESDKTASYAGGIAGLANDETFTADGCINYGTVELKTACGGILGAALNANVNLKSCQNSGTVNATDKSAGGILGYAKTTKAETRADKSITVERCTTSAQSKVSGKTRVGGIVGDNERVMTVNKCENNGSVTETAAMNGDTDTGCGGISGYTVGKMTITNSVNNGRIKSACQGVGGIVGKATSVTAPVPTETPDPEAVPDPEATPETTDIASKYTSIVKCANNGTVDNAPASPTPVPTEDPEATPTPTPDPAVTPTPTPATAYTYAGGILGYSDEIVSVDYCYNAGYVSGEKHVGGIAGAMVSSGEPVATPDPDVEPVDPAVTPTPTESLIKHSFNVGLVESKSLTEAVAGAILGSSDWDVDVASNFYLKNCVKPHGIIRVTKTADNTVIAQELETALFVKDDEEGLVTLLNADRVAAGLTPYFKLPDIPSGETELPGYVYSAKMKEMMKYYNTQDPTHRLTLPRTIPQFE